MSFKRFAGLMLAAMTELGLAHGQEGGSKRQPQMAVFEQEEAPGRVDQGKLWEALKSTMRELHTSGEALPTFVVFHINESKAEQFGVRVTSVWRTGREDGARYELWILGEPTDEIYSRLSEIFLEKHFGITIDDTERKRVVRAVKERLAGMVSVEELRQNRPLETSSRGRIDRRN